MEKEKTNGALLLIDANSLIHRAFHALPPLTTPDGRPAGALYGLASIFIKVLRERPYSYIAAAFDRPETTFREKEYAQYKATRAPATDDLVLQIIEARTLFEKFGVKYFEEPGLEADDIIAALSRKFGEEGGIKTIILSGDLDALQAVRGDTVVVEAPKRGISDTVVYNEEGVKDRFGVPPRLFADYKGLVGDTSDNIPGAPGIGPKTASTLIGKYGKLEDMYKEIEEMGMENEKLRKKLLDNKEQVLLSKRLAELKADMELPVEKEDIKTTPLDKNSQIIPYLKTLGFESLAQRISDAMVG